METPTKLPFSPNNILARLEELKRWQHEQEERLKQRQIKQRELLSNEQRRMCQAFDLIATNSFISTSSDEYETDQSSNATSNENSKQVENLSLRNNDEIESSDCHGNSLRIVDESKHATNHPEHRVNQNENSITNFDEIPISIRKTNIVFESENIPENNKMVDTKPKFTYLKRGEGLARFRMTTQDVVRTRQKALEKPNKSKILKKQKNPSKPNIKPVPRFKPSLPDRFAEKKTTVAFTEPKVTKQSIGKRNEPTWTHITSDAENKPRPGPYSVITSDAYYKLLEELKIKRDSEELKIFEILEEKLAHNSSFGSSSSVMHLLQDQSTPKLERMLQEANNQIHQNNGTSANSPPVSQRKLFVENVENGAVENADESLHVRFNGINVTDSKVDLSDSDSEIAADETPSAITDDKNNKYNDESEWSDDQSSNSESIEIETKVSEEKEKLSTNQKSIQSINNQVTDEIKQVKSVTESDDEIILKSDLLKKRLAELEKEIATFRKENANVIRKRQLLENERKRFLKDKEKKEKEFADEQKRLLHQLDEEKRKLFKEKMVFEKYVKESKNQPTRKEREEISLLKDEVKTLKERLKITETKYGASQARLRTQIRQLEKELTASKAEIEKLQKENKRLQSVQKRQNGISNTKVLHEINKNLSKMLPKALAENKLMALEEEEKSKRQSQGKTIMKTKSSKVEIVETESSSSSETDEPQKSRASAKSKKSVEQAHKSPETSSYEESDAEDVEQPKKLSSVKSALYDTLYSNRKHSYFPENTENRKETRELPRVEHLKINENEHADRLSHYFTSNTKENDFNYANRSGNPPTTTRTSFEPPETSRRPSYHPEAFTSNENMNNEFQNVRDKYISNIEEIYERTFNKSRDGSKSSPAITQRTESQTAKKYETILPDGSKEIHYSNGYIKNVSPDGNIIKLTYNNGDIKKTDLNNGIIKYFYAQTKTTHTTFPDGFEILEFANGQTEKRFKDGRVEIDFPNGYRKLVDREGNEIWFYADGTRVTTKLNGEKIIELPNGQKEIHSDDHKRREYPDGTVKILYPDKTTETRYANGRIRIKDKTGRLIMDKQI